MKYTIYCIDCPEHDGGLGKAGASVYFGQTMLTMTKRLSRHASKYSGCHKLKAWMTKRRAEGKTLRVTLLGATLHKASADAVEIALIAKHRATHNILNISDGGQGWLVGFKHTEETKERMRRSHTGKPRGPHSEETKRKISEANKLALRGNKNRKGIPHPPEIRAKISKTLKGRKRRKNG